MPELTTHLNIDAPAALVWEVIGPGFARIGDWATSVPASMPAPASAVPIWPSPATASGPPAGRTCRTGISLVPQITETLTSYDESGRTLTYDATGLPGFIAKARSTWTVIPAGDDRCRVTVTAHFRTRGVLGVLPCWAMLAQARLAARYLRADLRHYATHGTPSPRKQRQLQTRRPG